MESDSRAFVFTLQAGPRFSTRTRLRPQRGGGIPRMNCEVDHLMNLLSTAGIACLIGCAFLPLTTLI